MSQFWTTAASGGTAVWSRTHYTVLKPKITGLYWQLGYTQGRVFLYSHCRGAGPAQQRPYQPRQISVSPVCTTTDRKTLGYSRLISTDNNSGANSLNPHRPDPFSRPSDPSLAVLSTLNPVQRPLEAARMVSGKAGFQTPSRACPPFLLPQRDGGCTPQKPHVKGLLVLGGPGPSGSSWRRVNKPGPLSAPRSAETRIHS